MVDRNQGGQLMGRIKGVRKKLSQELGFLIPSVHIRDNLDLAPNAYRITLMGVPVGEAEIHPERDMAINPGQVYGRLPGLATKDPAFGLEAVWIEAGQREQAQSLGYTVVDASTVVATHLSHILQTHAAELLGHEEVQHLLNNLAKTAPKLVEDLVPKKITLGGVLRVLQSLLREGIPIRDMRSIAETLAERAPISQDPGVLTAAVRVALGRSIVQQISGIGADLPVMTLDPSLEQILHQTLESGAEAGGLEPGLAENLHRSLVEEAQRQEAAGRPAVLLVSQSIRTLLARFVRHSIPNLRVLAFNEIPDNKQVKIMATVGA
jgi:flagellar biosynthesis protein FlhA